jgi:hypothetical protein
VGVVTRLTKPIQAYLHNLGVHASIYVDDGKVCGNTKAETEIAMALTVDLYRLAGWNIQWTKTELTASRQVKYLGFHIDLHHFTYTALQGKLADVAGKLQEVVETTRKTGHAATRSIAQALGKLAALKVSHGPMVFICTRHAQHDMGVTVLRDGWDGHTRLEVTSIREMIWAQHNLSHYNERGIRDETGPVLTFSLEETRDKTARVNLNRRGPPDIWRQRGDTSWTSPHQETVEKMVDFPEGQGDIPLTTGVRELIAIADMLGSLPKAGDRERWSRVHWRTSSSNCHQFFYKGARQEKIQDLVLHIRKLECEKKRTVKLIWEVSHPAALQEADDRSRQYTSTDEWGADRQDLHQAFLILGATPTVDAFASRKNTICQTFFSKWPQLGGAGVDFFAQTLSSQEVYFCCPPVAEAAHTIRKLCSSNNTTAILVLPAWHSALHWALLRTCSGFIPEVRASTEWTGRGQDTGRGVSLFGLSHNTNFWAGLIQTGSIFRSRHINPTDQGTA